MNKKIQKKVDVGSIGNDMGIVYDYNINKYIKGKC